MKKAIFYHAGCPVCISAEQQIIDVIDTNRFNVESIHLGERRSSICKAEQAGVVSVPALVIDGTVLHINFGASLSDVKGA
ncbi:MAG: thioredoxin family protein [Alcanivoracaceae bacterium]|nr:thioredoxin family protein [Alcanivoracaceae bacterium]